MKIEAQQMAQPNAYSFHSLHRLGQSVHEKCMKCEHTCLCACWCVCWRVCTCVCLHACECHFGYMSVCIHKCVYACTCASTCVCARVHVHACLRLCVKEGNKMEVLNWVQMAETIQVPSKKN